ncbi:MULTISPECIES: HNH endonuclease [unclassified Bradyrhizobium]|uniref:HNH endonuclease n=1 Tax=unclassified Bradyrhizobium TaxID=2631580 RepID=UPI0028ECFC30|nr:MULTISPECIES: HNH endonuclease [unclassified Bradyrhizobium]
MAFGVFVHRLDSIYDDCPAEQYQFPGQYLSRAEPCVGDWVIYYEPSKVAETRGYFAVAKVSQIIPDPSISGMYVALIEPGSYLDFANPVPFSGPAGPIERGLLNDQGRISGRAQSAVRSISPSDFHNIVELGFAEKTPLLPRFDGDLPSSGLDEEQLPFRFGQERERISVTVSRVMRDRIFRRVVLRAYDERCAITGLKLINGSGRAEVAAAHIRPVEANGPDIVSNGIALSGTAHWMFDRGLIGLADDLEILVSRQTNDPEGVRTIINKTGRALAPRRQSDRPHPHFLKWHREHCFKQ